MVVTDSISLLPYGFAVLGAINFQDQALCKLSKIQDITIQWHLSAKVLTLFIQLFQIYPELYFFGSQVLAEISCRFS
jgi:hypothetical protein